MRPWIASGLFTAVLLVMGLVVAPGLHDNDWPLLMWLAHHASFADPSPLAVGHYPPLQLLLVRALPGSTVVAAKVLNALASGASALLVFRITAGVSGHRGAGWLAFVTFVTTKSALLTGQSEFGDPIALAAFLFALDRVLLSDRWFTAGLAFAAAAATRTHMQTFGFACVATLLLSGISGPRLRLLAGLFFGMAPLFALNLHVHGRLSSPIVSSFVGQVLFGYDDYDLARTYNLVPFDVVLREHSMKLLSLIGQRLTELPREWHVWSVVAVGALWIKDDYERRRALWLLLLAAGYYVGCVAPAWGMTPRLLLPFAALLSILAPIIIASTAPLLLRFAALIAVIVGLIANLQPTWRGVRDQLAHVNHEHDAAQRLTEVLRKNGMIDQREAFVCNWNRWPTDDPRAITYYNFGFWNLLNPAFAAERPNPIDTVGDPAAFAAFMRSHGVRFVVVQKIGRFAALVDLPGFERIVDLGDDVVFKASAR